jgi:hypothetical protein
MTKTVSIILPAYNEEKRLENSIKRLSKELNGVLDNFEIVISEDGSSDRTLQIAKSFESDDIRVLHSDKRSGKGGAIKNALMHCRGNFIVFMDVDLASHPRHVKDLVDLLQKGNAIVIGSRYMKGSKSKRSKVRYVASKAFNFMVRVLLGSKLTDHQCGFKAFRKDLVYPVIEEVKDDHWFWDTELLVRTQRKGLKVVEIPIEWKEEDGSKFRLVNDTIRMGLSLLVFKIREI